jgi:hypothetical protein
VLASADPAKKNSRHTSPTLQSREKGLSPSGFGKPGARHRPGVVRSSITWPGSFGRLPVTCFAAHRAFVRAAPVSAGASTRCSFCPPPAGGRQLVQLFCLRYRYGRTLWPIRRVAARRPPGVGLPPGSTAGHMAMVADACPVQSFLLPGAALPRVQRHLDKDTSAILPVVPVKAME